MGLSVMPFGLCNAPATMKGWWNASLGNYSGKFVSATWTTFLFSAKQWTSIWSICRQFSRDYGKLTSNSSQKKCHFFQKQVSLLRHVREGISRPTESAENHGQSSTKRVHELRSVMGFLSYYRRFIPHFSELAKPMIKLTEKDKLFQWNEEQQKAFQDLKKMLSQVLFLFNPSLREILSWTQIGAVFSQEQDGQGRVVAYGSKMLTKTECNYCNTRRELMAVIYFVTQFKHFLLGCKFLIRTDNSAVRYWMRIHSDSYDP